MLRQSCNRAYHRGCTRRERDGTRARSACEALLYRPLIGSRAAAWDTWMAFDRVTMWSKDSVPRPAWWEHQMSSGPKALMLDPNRWASHAIALHDVNAD